jgi:hypothetical protein
MRRCQKCQTNQSKRWYRGPLCVQCYQKRWQRDNKEKVSQYTKTWKNKNPEKEKARHLTPKARFINAKNGAATRGKIWNITFERFSEMLELPCHYCNNVLCSKEGYGSGLDRIENEKDYNPDNVIPCCKICNSVRNNYFTVEETKVAVQAIVTYRKMNEVSL